MVNMKYLFWFLFFAFGHGCSAKSKKEENIRPSNGMIEKVELLIGSDPCIIARGPWRRQFYYVRSKFGNQGKPLKIGFRYHSVSDKSEAKTVTLPVDTGPDHDDSAKGYAFGVVDPVEWKFLHFNCGNNVPEEQDVGEEPAQIRPLPSQAEK